MTTVTKLQLGRKFAPPRFLLFVVLIVAGLAVLVPSLGAGRGAMAAFDIASSVFLIISAPLLGSRADAMRQHAKDNDANRALLLAIGAVVPLVIMVAVAMELGDDKSDPFAVALIVGTLVLSWLFSNTIYALHYAHVYYTDDGSGADCGGIDLPNSDEPDYWDFVYFAFTLGMTFQTSDVEITAARIRRITIGHCLAAFVFNIGVLAFTINVLGN